MILAAAQSLPDGYPWVTMGWSALGFGGGYLVGRAHCWMKRGKHRGE